MSRCSQGRTVTPLAAKSTRTDRVDGFTRTARQTGQSVATNGRAEADRSARTNPFTWSGVRNTGIGWSDTARTERRCDQQARPAAEEHAQDADLESHQHGPQRDLPPGLSRAIPMPAATLGFHDPAGQVERCDIAAPKTPREARPSSVRRCACPRTSRATPDPARWWSRSPPRTGTSPPGRRPDDHGPRYGRAPAEPHDQVVHLAWRPAIRCATGSGTNTTAKLV